MNNDTIYMVKGADLLDTYHKVASSLRDGAFDRYAARVVKAHTVCDIHDIHIRTLYRYVKEGRLTPLPRQGKESYKFQLSEVLAFEPNKNTPLKNLR